jgi:ankyrin repeat protein
MIIGKHAFLGCTNLAAIKTAPDTFIQKNSFKGCTVLKAKAKKEGFSNVNEFLKIQRVPQNSALRAGRLVDAAETGDTTMVRELLAAGVDVNFSTEGGGGRTAIYMAAMEGHLEVVNILIDARADVDKVRTDGCSPLFTAAGNGHLEVVKALAGAKADVNKTARDGSTAFMWATGYNQTSVAEYLKSVGAR